MATNGKAGFHTSATHPARVIRNVISAMFGQTPATVANTPTTARNGSHGVVGTSEFLVTTTTGLGWSCSAGRIVVAGSTAPFQGAMAGYNDAAVTGALTARNATNPRRTIIAYRVRDTDEDATGFEDDGIVMIDGTAAATPLDPSLPSSLGSLELLSRANVPSAANGGPVTYDDLRSFVTALGGMQRHRTGAPASGAALDTSIQTMDISTYRTFKNSNGTWVPTSGRVGVEAVNTAGSLGSGASAVVGLPTELYDSDGFHAGSSSDFVVPAGLGGVYLVNARVTVTTAPSTQSPVVIRLNGNEVTLAYVIPLATQANATAVMALAPGDTVSFRFDNNHSGTQNLSLTGTMNRISD